MAAKGDFERSKSTFVVVIFSDNVGNLGISKLGDVGDAEGLMGLEKLIDPRRVDCSVSCQSPDLGLCRGASLFSRPGITPGPRSRLTPRPPGILGGGELKRSGGSTLAGRRFDLVGTGGGDAYSFGRVGNGGGVSFCILDGGRRLGDGSRKVRSVMEPELFCLCRLPGRRPLPWALPLDEVDPWRCNMRLVFTSLIGVGVVVWERKAAAAAAADRFALDTRLARNAWAAAVAAAGVGGAF